MNFNILLSVSSIYYVIKNNNLTYKKTHVITNPYSIVEQKEQLKTVYIAITEIFCTFLIIIIFIIKFISLYNLSTYMIIKKYKNNIFII